jgi:hypothetical protein
MQTHCSAVRIACKILCTDHVHCVHVQYACSIVASAQYTLLYIELTAITPMFTIAAIISKSI